MNSQLLPTQDVQREIWLAASFHLPFPLGYLSDPQFANWKNIRKQIKDLLLQGEKEFEILNVPTNGHVRFPGGDPIGIKYNRFWKTINLEYRLRTSGLIPANSNLLLNHQIWICPHGTVLLVGKLTLDAIAQKIRIEDLDKTVQSIYAEFSKVFLNIVQALKPFCRKTIIPDVMCFRKDQSIIKNFVMCESSSLDDEADFQNLDCEDKDEMVELLEDVYYVDFVPKTDGLLLNIGYFSSEVHVEPDNIVPCNIYKFGYSRFNLIRASAVVNCQSILFVRLFLAVSHAATSVCMVVMSAILRSRHCPFRTLSSISAIFNQLPCLGV